MSAINISDFPYPEGTPGADFKNNGGRYIHNLSEPNRAILEELKQWVVAEKIDIKDLSLDILHESLILLRYLRANNFNSKKTKKQIVTNIEWRRSQNIPELMKQDPEEILGCKLSDLVAHFPHWHYNYDKTGRPLLFKRQGAFDMKLIKQLCGGSFDRMFRYHVWEQELTSRLCYEQSLKTRTIIETVTVVVDVKGLTLSSIGSDFRTMMSGVVTMDQDMYPETLGKILVINAPSVFPMIYAVLRPLLDPITAAKVNIKGTDFKALLEENVGLDCLPSNYHGVLPPLSAAIHPYAEAMALVGGGALVAAAAAQLAQVKICAESAGETVFDELVKGAVEDGAATPAMTEGSLTPVARAEEA
jgi:hypothetical protein